MRTCLCVFEYACSIYMYVCIFVNMHECMFVNMHVYLYTYVCMYEWMHVFIYVYIYIYVCMYSCRWYVFVSVIIFSFIMWFIGKISFDVTFGKVPSLEISYLRSYEHIGSADIRIPGTPGVYTLRGFDLLLTLLLMLNCRSLDETHIWDNIRVSTNVIWIYRSKFWWWSIYRI